MTHVYHGPEPAIRLSALERAIVEPVSRLVAGAELDAYLTEAARLLITLGDGSGRDALARAGLSDAFAIPLVYTVIETAAPLAAVEGLLRTDVARSGVTHFGVGVAGTAGAARVALLFVRRGATLSRFPKRLAVGDRYLLTGRLEVGLRKPKLLIATPRGRVHELEPRYEHGTFWRMIPFAEGPGRYTVEVQAESDHGVQVLNLMEIVAGAPDDPTEAPIVRLRPPQRPVTSALEAEARALELINRSRQQVGLRTLYRSDRLRKEAHQHSADMATHGFFGHVSPTRGDLGTRVRNAGLPRGTLATENVAIAPTPDVAHRELLRSPSHMRNILDPQVNQVGVGVVRRDGGPQPVFTFTQIFARTR